MIEMADAARRYGRGRAVGWRKVGRSNRRRRRRSPIAPKRAEKGALLPTAGEGRPYAKRWRMKARQNLISLSSPNAASCLQSDSFSLQSARPSAFLHIKSVSESRHKMRTDGRPDGRSRARDGATHETGGRRTERIARSPSSEGEEEDVDRLQSMAGSLGDHCLRRVIVAHPTRVEEKMAVIIEIQLAQMPT